MTKRIAQEVKEELARLRAEWDVAATLESAAEIEHALAHEALRQAQKTTADKRDAWYAAAAHWQRSSVGGNNEQ